MVGKVALSITSSLSMTVLEEGVLVKAIVREGTLLGLQWSDHITDMSKKHLTRAKDLHTEQTMIPYLIEPGLQTARSLTAITST